MILELAEEIGLQPIKVSSTNGGEYTSSCPECGGRDRFRMWPNQCISGRYWCRKCLRSGDALQFCRDFMKMTFQAASLRVGNKGAFKSSKFVKKGFIAKEIAEPNSLWLERATQFVEKAHDALIRHSSLLKIDKDRGLSNGSIEKYKLGFNSVMAFDTCKAWGLDSSDSQKMCLPKGIVMPAFRDQKLIGVKIRRSEWRPEDKYSKYQIVNGGIVCPSIYGDLSKPVVLIEAELDAMLVNQLADDLCGCVALGGVSNKPDNSLHSMLLKAPLILYALDFDDAGKAKYQFWRSIYPNLRPWTVPIGKSPGDAFALGVDLRGWVQEGIKSYKRNEHYGKE